MTKEEFNNIDWTAVTSLPPEAVEMVLEDARENGFDPQKLWAGGIDGFYPCIQSDNIWFFLSGGQLGDWCLCFTRPLSAMPESSSYCLWTSSTATSTTTYIDPANPPPPKACDCDMAIVMSVGCKCGGV